MHRGLVVGWRNQAAQFSFVSVGKIERLGFIQAVFIIAKRTVSHASDAPPFHSSPVLPVLPGCLTEDEYLPRSQLSFSPGGDKRAQAPLTSAHVSIRQHTSAYASIRQHT
jgi:hypothetical protein